MEDHDHFHTVNFTLGLSKKLSLGWILRITKRKWENGPVRQLSDLHGSFTPDQDYPRLLALSLQLSLIQLTSSHNLNVRVNKINIANNFLFKINKRLKISQFPFFIIYYIFLF